MSRKDQLYLRGMRVDWNGPDASRWRDEAFLELKADAEWAKRHGRVEGGAAVARFVRSLEQTHGAREN